MLAQVAFWAVVFLTLGSAVYVTLSKNIMRAAFALVVAFGGVAGLFFFLQADFLAVVQFLVYVGGIVVLMVFAVMFSPNVAQKTFRESSGNFLYAIPTTLAVAILILATISGVLTPTKSEGQAENSTSDQIGARFYRASETDAQEPAGLIEDQLALTINHDHAEALNDQNEWTTLHGRPAAERPETFKSHNLPLGRPTSTPIAELLLSKYVLPFELAGILLLAVTIGAIVLVRKETRHEEEETEGGAP
ncbi:MAG: NADH-quinone oxidoreductase subunit J [Planctomycetes bacterium]|nr:NADH-quinone oxidoreductase subunit J [Planctomycetota bacterium]